MPSITVRLDPDLAARLDDLCARSGRTRSQVVRSALVRQLALESFDNIRRKVLPFAEDREYLTDEDVFSDIS